MDNPNSIDRYEVRSLVRGLKILETLENVGTPLRLTDLADEMGVERATLFRYCSTLTRHGYLHVDPATKTYSLGPRVRSLGYAAQKQWAWLDEVRARLPAVAELFFGAASFAVLDGDEIIYVERAVADRALNYQISPGDRLPAWTTSIGKILLADLPETGVRSRLARHLSNSDIEALLDELAEARKAGMAINIQGISIGLNSVAVPLRASTDSSPIGGINLAGSARDLPKERLKTEVAPVLMQLASEIAATAVSRD